MNVHKVQDVLACKCLSQTHYSVWLCAHKIYIRKSQCSIGKQFTKCFELSYQSSQCLWNSEISQDVGLSAIKSGQSMTQLNGWSFYHHRSDGKKRSHSWNLNSQLPRLIDKERSFKSWDVFAIYGCLSSHSHPGILRFGRTNNHIDHIRKKLIAVACYLLRDFFPWTLKCLLKNNHLRLDMTLIT